VHSCHEVAYKKRKVTNGTISTCFYVCWYKVWNYKNENKTTLYSGRSNRIDVETSPVSNAYAV